MAIDRVSEMMTKPNVAVFQSGGNVIPGVPNTYDALKGDGVSDIQVSAY
jgi:hypothetical protein